MSRRVEQPAAAARLRSSSQLEIPGGNPHELFEERRLAGHALQRLGVPLDGQDEWLLGILNRLDGPVRRPSALAQAGAKTIDPLVMERVDAESSRAQHRRQPAAGKNRDGMGRNAAIYDLTVRDRVADNIRQVLVQRAAAGDIERLRASTDSQDRKL